MSAGFRPTTNYNYSYNAPPGVQWYDPNVKYDNHFYGPYKPGRSDKIGFKPY